MFTFFRLLLFLRFLFFAGFSTRLGKTLPNSRTERHFLQVGRPSFIVILSKSSLPCFGQKHLACIHYHYCQEIVFKYYPPLYPGSFIEIRLATLAISFGSTTTMSLAVIIPLSLPLSTTGSFFILFCTIISTALSML